MTAPQDVSALRAAAGSSEMGLQGGTGRWKLRAGSVRHRWVVQCVKDSEAVLCARRARPRPRQGVVDPLHAACGGLRGCRDCAALRAAHRQVRGAAASDAPAASPSPSLHPTAAHSMREILVRQEPPGSGRVTPLGATRWPRLPLGPPGPPTRPARTATAAARS